MKSITIAEAERDLRALIEQARGGESVVIVDRGVPVARLVPASPVRTGNGPSPLELFRHPAPSLPPGVSAVDALLDERRTGR